MSRSLHTESDRALWLIHCVSYTAEELGLTVSETARLLEKFGLVEQVLKGYKILHTQGYEYMAELLSDELRKAQGVYAQ